jgi:hypothetical protein
VTERRPRNIHEYRGAVLSKHGPPSGIARCVAITLAQFMDSKTLETIVGIPRIAASSGFCERSVRTELRTLSTSGWISERSKGRGHPVIRSAMLPADTPAPHAAPPRHGMPEVTPANGAGDPGKPSPGTPAPHAAYLDQNLEKSLGAASPTPANAVSAALEAKSEEVMRLHGDGLEPKAIAKRLRSDYGVLCNTSEVSRLIARVSAAP